MDLSLQIDSLRGLTVGQLRERYAKVFREECRSYHRSFIVKRIAWRLQVLAEGDISEQVRQQARQLACDADIRIKAPKGVLPPVSNKPSPTLTIFRDFSKPQETRLPATGQLVRHYQGRDIVVEVEGNKFRYEDKLYKSLSAIAKVVTGTHWNGFTFFGISNKKRIKKENQQ